MTEPPPRKRFKQISIMESLKGLRRSKSDASSTSNTDQDRELEDLTQSSENSEVNSQHQCSTTEAENSKVELGKRKRDALVEPKSTVCSTSATANTSSDRQETDDIVYGAAATEDTLPLDSQGSHESGEVVKDSSTPSPLFSDSDQEDNVDFPELTTQPTIKDDIRYRGAPKSELNTIPECSPLFGPLRYSASHVVFIETNIRTGEVPKPYPQKCHDKWDQHHVRMPCSKENLYPCDDKNGKKNLRNRWELIETSLRLSPMTSSLDIEEAVLQYNIRYSQKWDFRGLHTFFMDVIPAEEARAFFADTLPKMVQLTLQLPEVVTMPIPLLKKQKLLSLTFSQHQVACLLANAFFCTFPRRNAKGKQSEYSSFPEINFVQLFQGTKNGINHRKAEKLKCILHYFRRVTSEMPTGTVTFTRQLIKDFPRWETSDSKLTKLHVTSEGTIEDDGVGMLQVDFANKYLGGGVLGYGSVQEEIRFLMCPELILSRLFTEVLERNECLIIKGSERFSKYEGYARSFRWTGDYIDKTPRDQWGRRSTDVVAIDAMVMRSYSDQFREDLVRRELHKAYCGFLSPGLPANNLAAVATGNWGCGAFGGDVRLKGLIQLMAAAEAKRDVCYFTFSNCDLRDSLYNMHQFVMEKNWTVSKLWDLIKRYYKNVCVRNKKPNHNLFDYIYKADADNESDTHLSGGATSQGITLSAEMSKELLADWDYSRSQSPDYSADTP